MQRIFLLSPAHVGGLRAAQLLNPQAGFALARQFRREGLPLGDVRAGKELPYQNVAGAITRGTRAPRLTAAKPTSATGTD